MKGEVQALVAAARTLAEATRSLPFGPPVAVVYHPLDYAWPVHQAYLERYGAPPKEVLLVGLNPGPHGMVQTGVPFGDPHWVRTWLRLAGPVGRPSPEHPRRPVRGFASARRELSGARLWGWAQQHFGTPEAFFARFFVVNYCPLAFFDAAGRNLTPDRLPAEQRRQFAPACGRHLGEVVDLLQPRWVVGLGRAATRAAREALGDRRVAVVGALHPSPASPAANRGWAAHFTAVLRAAGVALPGA
ncbi:MAG: single-strand selective monofunctional uracil DNA glycosylase [Porticoccaceae bacterium]|nr:MAG: single-strand selective monofunctional uracil DNA glycosylase [Porticoccaceae bacterium]